MFQVEKHLGKSNESQKEFRESLDRLEEGVKNLQSDVQSLQSDVQSLQSGFGGLVERHSEETLGVCLGSTMQRAFWLAPSSTLSICSKIGQYSQSLMTMRIELRC